MCHLAPHGAEGLDNLYVTAVLPRSPRAGPRNPLRQLGLRSRPGSAKGAQASVFSLLSKQHVRVGGPWTPRRAGSALHWGERTLTQGIGCRHRSESSRGTMAAVLPSVLTGGAMGQGAEGRGKQDWAAVLRWGLFFSGLLLRRGCARWNDRLLSFLLLFLLREWWVCQGPAFI